MTESDVSLLHVHDTDALIRLAASVGWSFSRHQAGLFLSLGTMYGYRSGDDLSACAGLFEFGHGIASLGIVIVHPKYQRQGLGKLVVGTCLREAERLRLPVCLVATEQGVPLYKALGFQVIGEVCRFQTSAPLCSTTKLDTEVTRLDSSDIADVVALDRSAAGYVRDRLYREWIHEASYAVGARDANGSLAGFAMTMPRGSRHSLGPLIAADTSVAFALTVAAREKHEEGLRIDVPGHQFAFMQQLQTIGFQKTLVSPVMVRGTTELPGNRQRLFGLVDPAMG